VVLSGRVPDATPIGYLPALVLFPAALTVVRVPLGLTPDRPSTSLKGHEMDNRLVQRTLYRVTHQNLLGKFCLVALAALPDETGSAPLLARLAEVPRSEVAETLAHLVEGGFITVSVFDGEPVYTLVRDTDDEGITFTSLKDKLWQTMEENPGTPYSSFVQMARDATVKYAGLKGLGTGVKLEDMIISHALGSFFPTKFASSESTWKSHSRWWALRKTHGTIPVLRVIQYVATYGDPDKGDPLRLAVWALGDTAKNPRGLTASRISEMRSAA
jgi:hypothetical protein